jgi:hypothetical protein
MPPDALPVTTYQHHDSIVIDCQPRTFYKYCSSDNMISWSDTISYIEIGNITFIQDALSSNELIAVADGSWKSRYATASWILTSPTYITTHQFIGTAQTPGEVSDHNSHRAEVTGLMGIMWTISKWVTDLSITKEIHVRIACNNDAALGYALNIEQYPEILSDFPDFDLLQQVCN